MKLDSKACSPNDPKASSAYEGLDDHKINILLHFKATYNTPSEPHLYANMTTTAKIRASNAI